MSETTQAEAPVATPSEQDVVAGFEKQFGLEPPKQKEAAPKESEQAQPEGELEAIDLDPVDTESEPDKAAPADEHFDIVHNGTTVKLSRAELIDHAQKGFDYNRKVQAVAESYKAFQAATQRAQELEQIQPILSQEAGQLQLLQQRLADPRYQDVEMLKLAQSGDLVEFQTRQAEREFLKNQLHATASQFQQKLTAVQQHREQLTRAQLEYEHSRLPELIPAWKDSAKMESEKGEIAKYLQANGADMANIGRYLDNAFAMKVLRQSMHYERLSKINAEKSKQLRDAPPVVRPGAVAPSDQGKANYGKTLQAIRKAGRAGDHHAQEQAALSLLNRAFPK